MSILGRIVSIAALVIQSLSTRDEGTSAIVPTRSDAGAEEDKWPAVGVAYDFVKPSYDWAIARFEAVSTRIQALQTIAATITLGTPAFVLAVRKDIHFNSRWFIAALVAFGLTLLAGWVGRSWGRLVILNPRELYDHTLDMPVWEFKRYALYYAGQHFERNATTVRMKEKILTLMTALFCIEIGLLIIWLVTGIGAASSEVAV
jgi:hypothetical protein